MARGRCMEAAEMADFSAYAEEEDDESDFDDSE